MNMPTNPSNVKKSSNFPISITFKFRTIYSFQLLHFNIDETIEPNLLVNTEIHSHDTRSNKQITILCVNRSKTKYCVLHNGIITWNSYPMY